MRAGIPFKRTRCQPDCPGQLGYATSPDGLHWQSYSAAPIFDATPLDVYERLDDGIWLATSPDLKVFTNVSDQPGLEIGPCPYDEVQVSMNQVFKYRGRYYDYYNGQERSPLWTTNLVVSDDLLNWRKFAGNPVLLRPIGFVVADGPGLRLYTMSRDVSVYTAP